MKKIKGIALAILTVGFVVGFAANCMAWEYHHGGSNSGWKADAHNYTTDVYH